MADKIKKNEVDERVPAIELANPDGETYTLDFNKEAVSYAESRGFEVDNVLKYPVTNFPELFYLAFRMHHGPKHGNISRAQTDKIYEALGGFSPDFLQRLILLYNQAAYSNNAVETTEEMGKNSGWKVTLLK